MKIVFEIPYPPTKAGRTAWSKQYGLNTYWSGKHWAQRKKDADYWHYLVRSELRRAGNKALRGQPSGVYHLLPQRPAGHRQPRRCRKDGWWMPSKVC